MARLGGLRGRHLVSIAHPRIRWLLHPTLVTADRPVQESLASNLHRSSPTATFMMTMNVLVHGETDKGAGQRMTSDRTDEQTPDDDSAARPFARHLRMLRERAGTPTIEAIARKASCSTGAVSNALNGKAVPSDQVGDAVLRALGGEPDEAWRQMLTRARRPRRPRTPAAPTSIAGPATAASDQRPALIAPARRRLSRTVLWWTAASALFGTLAVAVILVIISANSSMEPPKSGDPPPAGDGPWPFTVADVGPLGLVVRSSGDETGTQIGSTSETLTLWADCVQNTGFDPRPDTGAGPLWYRIRWPTDRPGKDFLTSSPVDRYRGWVYVGFVVPSGHNGQIPQCSSE